MSIQRWDVLESTKVVLKAGGTYVLFPDHLKEIEEAFTAGWVRAKSNDPRFCDHDEVLAAYLKEKEEPPK